MKKKLWFRTFGKLSRMHLTNWIPDRQCLKIMYYEVFGKKSNLENLCTFMKNYVGNKIGSQYLILI